MSPPLISKAAARYTGAGGKEHCSLCRHFSPRRGGRCARVLGDISPMGWCRLFSREIRALIADVPFVAGGGGPVPSLALDFMTPGTLSPLLTFTRASTGTYFDSAGVMQTAAVNAPRWDYDPVTLQLRGLLLEDQRANLAFPSVVNNTAWTVGAGTLTLNAVVAPDGTNTASLFIDNATVAPHGMTTVSTVSYANATAYTISIYAKQASARGLQIYTSGAPFGAPYANFDLQAGIVGTTSGATATIQSVGNGWYRCIMTATATAATSGVAFVTGLTNNLNNAPRSLSYAGTGTGVYLWGAQTELGDFATSYIPTTTVAVTRSIDSCLIPPANMGWFTGPGGSWFAEFDYFDATPTNSRVIARPDWPGSVGPYMLGAARAAFQYDGVGLSTANAGSSNAVTKGASTWAAGQAKICLNGGAIASAATLVTGYGVLATTGIRLLSVGAALSADNTSGHLRVLRYWPTVLTDAQMQAMTA